MFDGARTSGDTTRLQAFYSRESQRYDRSRYETRYGRIFHRLHHEVVADALATVPRDAAVLEVACGTGHTTALLTHLGFRPMACDLTADMIRRAVQATAEAAARPAFLLTNAQRLPFADATFDTVVSTRFLHLFHSSQQERLLVEMTRVLRSGGLLVVDFDNWSSRWLWALPYLVYNLFRYRRLAPYSVYNRVRPTQKRLENLGFSLQHTTGVGGTHLIVPGLLSEKWAIRIGRLHHQGFLRVLAEQFLVTAIKR